MESLAVAFAETVHAAARLASRHAGGIHTVGGGSLNALLRQLSPDGAGLPVLAGPVEATELCNVPMGAYKLGLRGTLEELRELVVRAHAPVCYDRRRS